MVITQNSSLPSSTTLISSVWPWEFTRGSTWDTSCTRFDTNTSAPMCTSFYHYTDDMSAAAECFESLKIASIISEAREGKNLPGKRELHIPGRASALLDSHAELIALPKHSCLNHISRRLSAAENENSLPYTSKSGNQKRHQISPHSVLFLSWHSRETWFKMLHCREIGDETVTKVERCLA